MAYCTPATCAEPVSAYCQLLVFEPDSECPRFTFQRDGTRPPTAPRPTPRSRAGYARRSGDSRSRIPLLEPVEPASRRRRRATLLCPGLGQMSKVECQTSALQDPMRRTKYTAEVLGPIVASSRTFTEVIRKLGLKPTGGNHRYISSRIRLAELDISHFHGGMRGKVDALTAETLAPIVARSRSVAAVCAAVGLPPKGRPHRELARRLRELNLDMAHFLGAGWSRGFTAAATHPSLNNAIRANRIPDEGLHRERCGAQRNEHHQAAAQARRRVPLRDLWHRRMVRSSVGPPPRSHQRHPQRPPPREQGSMIPISACSRCRERAAASN